MTTKMYCFVSGGDVHCVPVEAVPPESLSLLEVPRPLAGLLRIKQKNRLYTLNDPLLSDLDSTSVNEDEDDEDDEDEATGPDTLRGGARVAGNPNKKSLYLPHFSLDLAANLTTDYHQVKELLVQVFPAVSSPAEISVRQLTGGITNMLLSCKHVPLDFTVLMRVYGQGTNLIIDRHREFVLHLVLNSLNLAPPIYARFKNGLVYGFLPGRLLQPAELQDPRLYPLIAQQLGIWHAKVLAEDIEEGVDKLRKFTNNLKKMSTAAAAAAALLPAAAAAANGHGRPRAPLAPNGHVRRRLLLLHPLKPTKRSISNVWELIEDWIHIVPLTDQLIESFSNAQTKLDRDNIRQVVQDEFEWLRTELSERLRLPVVACHCDLLSGNIIVPESLLAQPAAQPAAAVLPNAADNPIQFIDYEYMLPAPRAFDIANHLAEWQGFDCNRAAVPRPLRDNAVMVAWVKGYLNNCDASAQEVNLMIDEIAMFYGMPGFYWGVWAMIQSEISNIEFDYANYGQLRLQEYWDWKALYLS